MRAPEPNETTLLLSCASTVQELMKASTARSLQETLQTIAACVQKALSADQVSLRYQLPDGRVFAWPLPGPSLGSFPWTLSTPSGENGELHCSFQQRPQDDVPVCLTILAAQASLLLQIALLEEQLEMRDPIRALFEQLREADLLTDSLLRRAARLGIDLAAPHVFCVADILCDDPLRLQEVVNTLQTHFQNAPVLLAELDDMQVCLIEPTSVYDLLRRAAETVSRTYGASANVYFGVGAPAPTPQISYRGSLQQALQAVQAREHLNLPPHQHVIQFGDLPLLSSPFLQKEENPYDQFVQQLARLDLQNGSQWLDILEKHVRPGGTSLRQIAKELGGDPSYRTVQRTIENIAAMLAAFGRQAEKSVDLKNPHIRAALYTSILQWRRKQPH